MKILIEKESGIVKYKFTDIDRIIIEETKTITPYFVIADMNINNSEIVENVTPPEDYIGNKYIYNKISGEFTLNPDF